MKWKRHGYRVGSYSKELDDLPASSDELDALIAAYRRRIEPWRSAGTVKNGGVKWPFSDIHKPKLASALMFRARISAHCDSRPTVFNSSCRQNWIIQHLELWCSESFVLN